jgi:hypothetical protein
MKPVDDPGDLSDAEAEAVAQAVDIFRSGPTSPSSFRTVPIRDDTGRLCEVQFFAAAGANNPLAVIAVSHEGAVAPMEDLP